MTIFICGDSTAATYTQDLAPLTGWGQVLPDYLEHAQVDNHAMAGRSSKSFLYEGRLLPVEEKLAAGDLLLIQFAHNDESNFRWRHTEPWAGYIHNLNLYIQTARLREATPVLLTPICIRTFQDGVLQPCHEGYLEAIHVLGQQTCTPVIDLYAMSFQAVKEAGEEHSYSWYMNLEPKQWPGYPDGRVDNVHTTEQGARIYAKLVADEMKRRGLI